MERETNNMYGDQSPGQCTRNKSILKAPKLREPLQELHLIPSAADDDQTSNTTRTSTRRVSFAKSLIKEFRADTEVMTLWGSSYYEEAWKSSSDSSHQTDSSNSGLSTNLQFKSLENNKIDVTFQTETNGLTLIPDRSTMCQNNNMISCSVPSHGINCESPVMGTMISNIAGAQCSPLNKHSKNMASSYTFNYNRNIITNPSYSVPERNPLKSLVIEEKYISSRTDDEIEERYISSRTDDEMCMILPQQDFQDKIPVFFSGSPSDGNTSETKCTRGELKEHLKTSVFCAHSEFQKNKRPHTLDRLSDIGEISNNVLCCRELDNNLPSCCQHNQSNKRHKGEHFCENDDFVMPLKNVEECKINRKDTESIQKVMLTSDNRDSKIHCTESHRQINMELLQVSLGQSHSALGKVNFQESQETVVGDTSTNSDNMEFTDTGGKIYCQDQLKEFQESLTQNKEVEFTDTVMKIYPKNYENTYPSKGDTELMYAGGKVFEQIQNYDELLTGNGVLKYNETPCFHEQRYILDEDVIARRNVKCEAIGKMCSEDNIRIYESSKDKRRMCEPGTTQVPLECDKISRNQAQLLKSPLACTNNIELSSTSSKHPKNEMKETENMTRACRKLLSENQAQMFSAFKENGKCPEQQIEYETQVFDDFITYGGNVEFTTVTRRNCSTTQNQEFDQTITRKGEVECSEAVNKISIKEQTEICDTSLTDESSPKLNLTQDSLVSTDDLEYTKAVGKIYPCNQSDKLKDCLPDTEHSNKFGKVNLKNQTLAFDKSSTCKVNMEMTEAVGRICSETEPRGLINMTSRGDLKYTEAADEKNQTYIFDNPVTRNEIMDITHIVGKVDSKVQTIDELMTSSTDLEFTEPVGKINSNADYSNCSQSFTSNGNLEYTEAVGKIHFNNETLAFDKSCKVDMVKSRGNLKDTEAADKINFKNQTDIFGIPVTRNESMEITHIVEKVDSKVQTIDELMTSSRHLEYTEPVGKIHSDADNNKSSKGDLEYSEAVGKIHSDADYSKRSKCDLEYTEAVGKIHFNNETLAFNKSCNVNMEMTEAVGRICSQPHGFNDLVIEKGNSEPGKVYPNDIHLCVTKKQFNNMDCSQAPEHLYTHSVSSQSSVEHRSPAVYEQILSDCKSNYSAQQFESVTEAMEVDFHVANYEPDKIHMAHSRFHDTKSAETNRVPVSVSLINSEDILPQLTENKYAYRLLNTDLMNDNEPVSKRSKFDNKYQETAQNFPAEITFEKNALYNISVEAAPSNSLRKVDFIDTIQQPICVHIEAKHSQIDTSPSISHSQFDMCHNTDCLPATTAKDVTRNNSAEVVLVQEQLDRSKHSKTDNVNSEPVLNNDGNDGNDGNDDSSSILHLSDVAEDEFDLTTDDISCWQAVENLKNSSGIMYKSPIVEKSSLQNSSTSFSNEAISGGKSSKQWFMVCKKKLLESLPQKPASEMRSCAQESAEVCLQESPQASVEYHSQNSMAEKVKAELVCSLKFRSEKEPGVQEFVGNHSHTAEPEIKVYPLKHEVCSKLCMSKLCSHINAEVSLQNTLTKAVACSSKSSNICSQKTTGEEEVVCLQEEVKLPQTIEEHIRRTEANDNCLWSINELRDQEWSFYFLYESLKLLVKFDGDILCKNKPVVDVHLISRLSEKSDAVASLVHRSLLRRMSAPHMKNMCQFSADVPGLLHKLSQEVAGMIFFMRDVVRLEIIYGVLLQGDCATFNVTSLLLHSWFSVTVDLSKWELLVPSDISAKAVIGTVREDDIRQLVNGIPRGPHFLLKYVQHVHNYIHTLEKTM